MRKSGLIIIFVMLMTFLAGCQQEVEHTAPAIRDRDSVPVMTSYGVNALISDSGVIKYRIVTERWEVNQNVNPSRWIFNKGVFLEAFDEHFHIYSYLQADTAYYYDKNRIWELHGRVHILTKDGLRFSSNELFWDENQHEIYSNKFSRLITPERTLQGIYFRSDEKMTKYFVSNTKGSFVKGNMMSSENDTMRTAPDTMKSKLRPQAVPRPKNTSIPLMH